MKQYGGYDVTCNNEESHPIKYFIKNVETCVRVMLGN